MASQTSLPRPRKPWRPGHSGQRAAPKASPCGRTQGSLILEAGQAYGCAEAGNSVLYSSWKVRSLNLRTARAAVRLCQERAGVRPAQGSWEGPRCQQGGRLPRTRGAPVSRSFRPGPESPGAQSPPHLCEPCPHLRAYRAGRFPLPGHLLWSEIPWGHRVLPAQPCRQSYGVTHRSPHLNSSSQYCIAGKGSQEKMGIQSPLKEKSPQAGPGGWGHREGWLPI